MSAISRVEQKLGTLPLVAILRGLPNEHAAEIGLALADLGFGVIEVPLNSPGPYRSIEILRKTVGDRCVVGAGTVTDPIEVAKVADAGGQICISPNFDKDVLKAALGAGLVPMPGVATATEAFDAIRCGAQLLKVFPASVFGSGYAKALKSVLPSDVKLFAVGGVEDSNIAEYLAAGYDGAGIGSSLYRPTSTVDDVVTSGQALIGKLTVAVPPSERGT